MYELIAKDVKVNLGNNLTGVFDIWIDEQGRLEIIPIYNGGDPGDWSYVLAKDKHHEFRLLSKQNF